MVNDTKWIDEAISQSLIKIKKTRERVGAAFPYTTKNGKYVERNNGVDHLPWWTNGFWEGILWLAYQHTNDESFKNIAKECEARLDEVLHNYDRVDHDAGFIWHLSAVADYKITGDDVSRRRGMLAAGLLAGRYNLKGHYIRAWNREVGVGWAIIDCMMNLTLLYWASEMLNDPRYKWIAMDHADMVMREFIRPDGSSHHIVCFDPNTGERVEARGGQGYSEDSSWSRGTAWALYGFVLSYYYTKEVRYLDTAKKIANFFIAALPEDYVPFADFKAPKETNIKKDSSAAACAASGLVLLSNLVHEHEKSYYEKAAVNILKSLYENFGAWDKDEEALLLHGCPSYHAEPPNDFPLIYGDYFFLEALSQLRGIKQLF